MKKVRITFIRQYRKVGTQNVVFVYGVTGTPEAVEAYKAAQGENLKHEDDDPTKRPLYFTTRATISNSADLLESSKGNWFVDTSALDRAANITAQFGGNFGNVLAQEMVRQAIGGAGASAPVEAPATATVQNP